MLNNIFTSIIADGSFTGGDILITTITAFICGLIIAGSYMFKNRCSRSFLVSLVLLPVVVELVIMLVNGNIGAGVAVAGAFSLVRFRSAPGKGQEITGIFLSMAVGLATGMGYIGIAIIFTLIVSAINIILRFMRFGADNRGMQMLKITVPENLDYEGRFEETFKKFLKEYTYDEVKLTNMGAMYKLTLSVLLKDSASSKEFLDELRTQNGNLDISLGRMVEAQDAL